LPDDLLVKVDIASMAYSLEARSPLLDHRLMEFTAGLPGSLKIRGTERKVVMREALRGWIPDVILDGPKRGFGLPMVGGWFRDELRDYIDEALTDPGAAGREYFDGAYVRELLDRHQDGSRDNSTQLWALLMFEVWHREVVG
jgi:asparagine synthase (glutamine-hydrolysing)